MKQKNVASQQKYWTPSASPLPKKNNKIIHKIENHKVPKIEFLIKLEKLEQIKICNPSFEFSNQWNEQNNSDEKKSLIKFSIKGA